MLIMGVDLARYNCGGIYMRTDNIYVSAWNVQHLCDYSFHNYIIADFALRDALLYVKQLITLNARA